MSEIIEKLDKFKDNYLSKYSPEAQTKINGLEKGLKKALLAVNLAEHDGFKIFIEKFRIEVDAINSTLISRRDIPEIERLFLFERRDWIEGFIRYFSNAKTTIKSTEKFLDTVEEDKQE